MSRNQVLETDEDNAAIAGIGFEFQDIYTMIFEALKNWSCLSRAQDSSKKKKMDIYAAEKESYLDKMLPLQFKMVFTPILPSFYYDPSNDRYNNNNQVPINPDYHAFRSQLLQNVDGQNSKLLAIDFLNGKENPLHLTLFQNITQPNKSSGKQRAAKKTSRRNSDLNKLFAAFF